MSRRWGGLWLRLSVVLAYVAALALVVWLGALQLQGTAPEFGYDCSGPYVLAEATCDR